jgi:hypothetical protein
MLGLREAISALLPARESRRARFLMKNGRPVVVFDRRGHAAGSLEGRTERLVAPHCVD